MTATNIIHSDDLHSMGFHLQYEDRWAAVYHHGQFKTIVCCLRTEYVPIEQFSRIFHRITELVANGDFDKFIFDKRSLRTFHQPSMEWYFLDWKEKMLDYGLRRHRKILPDLEWFKQAVSVAKKDLVEKLSVRAQKELDIQYCNSIEEALKA